MKVELTIALIVVAALISSCWKMDNPLDPHNQEQTLGKLEFNPSSGTYNTPQMVTISSPISGLIIRYTLDGSEPNYGSSIYVAPLVVAENTIIKAKATKPGWPDGSVQDAGYSFRVEKPTFDPPGDTYSGNQTITITCATPNANIHYTTDGTEPSLSSSLYNTPIEIDVDTTLKAIAFRGGWTASEISNAAYTIASGGTVDNPTFDPVGGTYSYAQNIIISCSTPGAAIKYTTDGLDPSPSSNTYTTPITVSSNTTIKAIATKSGWVSSGISTAAYNISGTQTVATPTMSPPGGSFFSPQQVSLFCSTPGATIQYSIDGSNPDQNSMVYNNPIFIAYDTTIKARATKDGWLPSPIIQATFTIDSSINDMVLVQGGVINIGNALGGGGADELPVHSAILDPFYIGKYEVSQSQWIYVMGALPASCNAEGSSYPVTGVSWYAAMKYCNLLSLLKGLIPVYSIMGSTNPENWGSVPISFNNDWNQAICNWSANGYRLPTEAEWEYAARSAANVPDYIYSGSNYVPSVAWYHGNNSTLSVKPVGTLDPNDLLIYDMSGNVWEWCWDFYSDTYYSESSLSNPTGPASGTTRVRRGGNWSSIEYWCRVAARSNALPNTYNESLGLRIVRSAK